LGNLGHHTVLRLGEALGLAWGDVDWEKGCLTIRRSAPEGKGLCFVSPKTRRSQRSIFLDDFTLGMLEGHLREEDERLGGVSVSEGTEGLVIRRVDGRAIDPSSVSYYLRKALRRAGIQSVRVHDLRHTHASLLLALGIHPKIVQERLGHSAIGVTMNTYSHVIPFVDKEAAKSISEALRKPLQSP
jgi:integrase